VTPTRLEITALQNFPLVAPGDDINNLILDCAPEGGFCDGDVLVIAQKIISKAEDRYVDLDTVEPSDEAQTLATQTEKDPRLVQLILNESTEIARSRPGVIIAAHRLGFVLANAGIDASNVDKPMDKPGDYVLLLPVDPDQSCRDIRQRITAETGTALSVIINDSLGRAWRQGTAGIALGAAGLPSLQDLTQQPDLHGRLLQVSKVGLADELAAAASLVQGQGDEGKPVILIRGFDPFEADLNAATLIRPRDEDMFR
jgi:coenzyme F420-0:L-glutamate ligase/coenzyme F420-1:gamma-L-glutamate ligase